VDWIVYDALCGDRVGGVGVHCVLLVRRVAGSPNLFGVG
jgi:hypothetical protein